MLIFEGCMTNFAFTYTPPGVLYLNMHIFVVLMLEPHVSDGSYNGIDLKEVNNFHYFTSPRQMASKQPVWHTVCNKNNAAYNVTS